MRVSWRHLLIMGAACWLCAGMQAARGAEEQPEIAPAELEFFEQKIRPVLVERCYACHAAEAVAAKKLKGGLRLDSRDALLRGGDSGPAVIPGQAADSLLLEALHYENLKMPPEGKLPDAVIADFERWISRGATDPRTEDSTPAGIAGIDLESGRKHWAYRPLERVAIPSSPSNKDVLHQPLDAFIALKLREHNLEPAPQAGRITLIRRVSFDLVGLPPAPDEIDEFAADVSPDAYERLVDRLLASPHFGERWARHWLSVARFGESLTLRGFILPEAWRYRDYVIEAFNADRPFDRFIVEQLAGDLLAADSLEERQRNLVATTYLSLGNTNLEEQDKRQLRMDVVDEQLDAIGKGFLAQTIGCARCHDHKFDPIPTRDYYALAGILASTKTLEHANVSKWLEFPLPQEPAREAVLQQHENAVAAVRDKMKEIQQAQKKLADKKPGGAGRTIAASELPGIVLDDRQAKVVGEWQSSQSVKPYIGDGYLHDGNGGKGTKTITFQPEIPQAGQYEIRLAYTPGDNRSEAVPVTVFSADGEATVMVNQRQRPPIDGLFISLGQHRFEKNGQGFVIVSNEGTADHVVVDAVQFLSGDEGSAKPQASDESEAEQDARAKLADELKGLQTELKRLTDAGPKRPMYMSVAEEQETGDICIHVRGSVHNQSERVPRGFLQVATSGNSTLGTVTNSGRQELGEWIAGKENPLTPRVLGNRVWHWLFGAGIVRTPDNFGTTGDAPSHPELLDHLAGRLRERGWSIKSLVRDAVSSRTYRQAATPSASAGAHDPENRWLSHQNRRRLDAECLLDALLYSSGGLDDALGGSLIPAGKSEDYGFPQQSHRRAVYWPVFRNALPEIFEAFDFADPSLPSGVRNTSTVAPQALYLLNDDWVKSTATQAAKRLLRETELTDEARIVRVFRLTLGRSPTPGERELTMTLVKETASPEEAWARLFHSLYATIDFRYQD